MNGKSPSATFENALTISAFCEKAGISRPTYYRMEKAGRGPIVTNASPTSFRPVILEDHYWAWVSRRAREVERPASRT